MIPKMPTPYNAPENFDWILSFKKWYLKRPLAPEADNDPLIEFVVFESDNHIQLQVLETAAELSCPVLI